ncbi:class I SAM-dependent methyltransferase [Bowmanella pacifica]|uniref:S-adenosyl-L-methionine-dependent methyltransferase n=1 Tax=Bowmanella pacifica TaxID=502051 RepID=A0A917YW19_9ALTE|nr:SAM-dependent methyltransferase [Bowmanella pacifica]GGO68293.1 hypothetical protein GCM10010982_16870 [Bowmanella pacifica]
MKRKLESKTAYIVLQGLLYLAKRTRFKFLISHEREKFAERMLQQTKIGRKCLKRVSGRFSNWEARIKESIFTPGITVHYALRKNYIEEATFQAIDSGVKQIVNLGAGLDWLTYYVSEKHPEVSCIEVDHPSTQKIKKQALAESLARRPNLHFLSVNFEQQNFKDALKNFEAFDPNKKTLFVSEGVLMYLGRSSVESIFNAIHTLTGTGTLFLFTSIEPKGSKRSNVRPLLFHYLTLIGEPIRWALASEDVDEFLAEQHCQLERLMTAKELRKKYILTPYDYTFHIGEYLVTGRFY